MARSARLVVKDEVAVYHVMSRTALDGFVFGDQEKEELFKIIQYVSKAYFTEVLGYCIMGTHFHLLVKMKTSDEYSNAEIVQRYQLYRGKEKKVEITEGQIPFYREKWSSLSEYMKEIKQRFSRFYNKKHMRRGFFWAERFKSVIVENGDTLINCLAYIDLNPVRAGLVKTPEEYRWCSVGYHVQTNNKGRFLSLDFGLRDLEKASKVKRLRAYRRFLYDIGEFDTGKGIPMKREVVEKEKKKDFELKRIQRFKYRTRYFTDSAVIGSKIFVSKQYQTFKDCFQTKNEKVPKSISGLKGIYSLKRLSELS